MGEESFAQEQGVDIPVHQSNSLGRARTSQSQTRLIWEMPLGVVRGELDDPGLRFVDVEGEADKEACRWERGKLCLGQET